MVVELSREELFLLEGGGWLGALAGGVVGAAVGYSTVGAITKAAVTYGLLATGATLGAPVTIAIIAVVAVSAAYVGYNSTR